MMKSHTTEELTDIITENRFDYNDYALKSAEKELEIRGVSVEEVKLEFEKSTKGFGKRINPYLIRRNDRRAKSTILFLWIIFSLSIFLLIFELQYHKHLRSAIETGEGLTSNQLMLSEMLVYGFTLLVHITELVLGILFISWFRRLYYNLHLIFNQLSYKEGWAAGCWFVPVLCFFRPYVIMKEIWQTLSDF
ncbi:MAG: DUF4328 domain-containing protein, partial [Bacteroidota bacterium]|nr:DUF4328 domain-containing protein [Bacteroidota bacterium]